MEPHTAAFDRDFFHISSSPSKDSISASTLHRLRAHHKTLALDDPSYESSGPINAIDRLLQNLSPLPPVTNDKAIEVRDYKWEIVEKRAQEKTLKIEEPVNAIDRIVQGITPLVNDGKQVVAISESWEVDTTVCGSVYESGTTPYRSDDGTCVEEVTPRQTQPCRKGKEKAIGQWIEEDDGNNPNTSDGDFDSGSAIWSWPSHQWNHHIQEHTDDASDAGSDATSVCEITEGPLTKLQFDHINGAERSRQERWRAEEQTREKRWKSELSQTQLLQIQQQRRQAQRDERREARKQRRENAIAKAEREERWQATKGKITGLLKEIIWSPAMMLQLPSRLCRVFGAAAIISPLKAVDEAKLEADTDTDDEKIRPDWSKFYFPRNPPEPPDNTELYNRARELNVMLQQEKHRWAKLKRHNEMEMRSGRTVILDYESPIELLKSQCKHCVGEHVDDIFLVTGPWWRECGICDSRGRYCERDKRDHGDDERKPPGKRFVPLGLIRAAKLGRRGDEDDDALDGESSDSESEDGNHGNDGLANQDTTPPPPMTPPVINYSKYGPCDSVQREFFEERHRDLQWKTGYLDNKLELGVLGDYIDYVGDRIEAIDHEPIHAGHHFREKAYQGLSERAQQLARHQREKHFWEGLRKNLELDELEVAGELQENHLRHRKDDEECRHLANEVNTLFKKHMVYESRVRQVATQEEQEEPHESQPTQDEVYETSLIQYIPAVDEWEIRRRAHEMYDVRDEQDMLASLDAQDTQAIADRRQRTYDRLLGERSERPDGHDIDWQLWDEAGEICERQTHEELSWAVPQEIEVQEEIPEMELEDETQEFEFECEEEDEFGSAHGEDNDHFGCSDSNNDDQDGGYASARGEETTELISVPSNHDSDSNQEPKRLKNREWSFCPCMYGDDYCEHCADV